MTTPTRDTTRASTGQLLVRRTRLVILICLTGGVLFGALELSGHAAGMGPSLLTKVAGVTLGLATLALLETAWAVRRARLVAVLVVCIAYTLTALAGALSPRAEYDTTAVLFVGAALVTATILPWGVAAQIGTVAVGAACLLAAVLYADGSLAALERDPAAAVMIAVVLSVLAAREVSRYRTAHRRELIERRRAESALRRLALRLEQRVAERTVALQRAHERLRHHQGELAHVLRLHTMGEMAAALAHEINQPLCAITNYAQGAVQRLRAGAVDPNVLRDAFEAIAREGLRAGEVLRGIRTLVQRESVVSADVDVNALAVEALRVLEPQARRHGVTVRLEGGAALPPIQADGTQIEQVILNLMVNGVEAASLTRHLPREVVVATAARGDEVEIAVSDTGTGLGAAAEAHLFTPFFTTKAHGLGLGLAISRSIVESHGGRLWATSQPGSGATFRFALPALERAA